MQTLLLLLMLELLVMPSKAEKRSMPYLYQYEILYMPENLGKYSICHGDDARCSTMLRHGNEGSSK